jgi:hypothetical protein
LGYRLAVWHKIKAQFEISPARPIKVFRREIAAEQHPRSINHTRVCADREMSELGMIKAIGLL